MQLLLVEFKRIWILYKRYPMNYFAGLLFMFFMFLGIIAGSEYISGVSQVTYNNRLDGVLLGYWQWNLAIFAFAYTTSSLQSEAAMGTLEQIFLSPLGALRIVMTRAVASLGLTIGTSTLFLLLLLHVLERQLSYPPLLIWPLMTALLSAYGVGLMLGALALIYKQISRVMVIVQIGIVPLVVVAFEEMDNISPWLYNALPIAPSSVALRTLMTRAAQPTTIELLAATANGAVFMAIGIYVFHWAARKAKRDALLGQH